VFKTGALQYIFNEILEGTRNEAIAARKKIIQPQHLMKTVMQDEDLRRSQCWPGITFANAGVIGRIHPALMQKSVAVRNKMVAIQR
jgi:hypothetical protein